MRRRRVASPSGLIVADPLVMVANPDDDHDR
jgi:hypothetical protein